MKAVFLLMLSLLAWGCASVIPEPVATLTSTPIATRTLTSTPTVTLTATLTATATQVPPTVTDTPVPPLVRPVPVPHVHTPVPHEHGIAWPFRGSISRYFSGGHSGIDIEAPHGRETGAATGGIVTFAGGSSCCGYGRYVKISGPNGVVTLYAHLSSFHVLSGQRVSQG
ncbi:hypothetical protein LCGC14_2625270, partial [marine sediment metagenome]